MHRNLIQVCLTICAVRIAACTLPERQLRALDQPFQTADPFPKAVERFKYYHEREKRVKPCKECGLLQTTVLVRLTRRNRSCRTKQSICEGERRAWTSTRLWKHLSSYNMRLRAVQLRKMTKRIKVSWLSSTNKYVQQSWVGDSFKAGPLIMV